jgi:hypothetical protein
MRDPRNPVRWISIENDALQHLFDWLNLTDRGKGDKKDSEVARAGV